MRVGTRRGLGIITTLGLLALAACGGTSAPAPPARAAPDDITTIAFLRAASSPDADAQQSTFLDVLADAGYVVGESLTVLAGDPTETHPDPAEASALVEQWADQGVDLILALSSDGALTASRAAPEIPVLFISTDPVATGLVDDERRPEANLTGVSFRVPADRLVDLARQLVDPVDTIGVLSADGDSASPPSVEAAVDAIEGLGLDAAVAGFPSEGGGEREAVAQLQASGADVVLLTTSPSLARHIVPIQDALEALGLPSVAATRATERAVVVLQPHTDELYRQLARQTVRILEGASPAEVPVEDPGQFRLVLNAGVAAELGLELPRSLLDQADRVING